MYTVFSVNASGTHDMSINNYETLVTEANEAGIDSALDSGVILDDTDIKPVYCDVEDDNETEIEIERIKQQYSKELNTDQKIALEVIVDWYFSNESTMILSGAAGTGKSFSVQRALLALIDILKLDYQELHFAVAAPTVKALEVIESNANAVSLFPHAATIHSLLHVLPGDYDAKGNQMLKENKFSRQPRLKDFQLTIIDECSMIDIALYERIMANVNSRCKVLFLGDICQLPPVNKDDEKTPTELLKLSPVFYANCRKTYLTKPVRYDGGIAKVANEIRQGIDSGTNYIPRFNDADNITTLHPTDWESIFIEKLKTDPLNVRAICWTNQATMSLANKARKAIYGDDEVFHVGEVLTAKELVTIMVACTGSDGRTYMKQQIILHSCEECVIESLEIEEKIVQEFNNLAWSVSNGKKQPDKLECFKLKIVTGSANYTLYTPTKKCLDEVVKPVLQAAKKGILELPSSLRGQEWKKYYEVLETLQLSQKGNGIIYRLQYAGVLTIHQSQGSGYKEVFYNAMNVWGCQNEKMRAHLAYTAVTRAKQHLYVCSKAVDVRFSDSTNETQSKTTTTSKAKIVKEKQEPFLGLFC